MDYLEEAIVKARQQGDGAIGATRSPGETGLDSQSNNGYRLTGTFAPGPTIAAQRLAARGRQASVHRSEAKFDYSTTRQVDLAPATLSHNRVIAGAVNDPRVESYRQLRSQVLSEMNHHGWTTLAITSADENAGKTLTAINLAISMSQEVNQTVLLVDLDLRKPNVHTTLGIDVQKGIVDFLLHGEAMANILINPGIPRLVILPGLPQGRHASEILSSPEMFEFLKETTTRYPDRIVIFDLPPLLRNDDAMVFVPNTDTCLLVVEDGVTRPKDLERSLELLKDAQLLGTVLNKAR